MGFLIYGANGYTGQLMVERAVAQGLQPVVAGRNQAEIKKLADAYQLDHRCFSLDNVEDIASKLKDIDLVIHCAGPFIVTAKNMVEACLLSSTHYLDITGELMVFEKIKSYHKEAVEKGIVLMPGTGFDVVPTDSMAKFLSEKMPDATHLELAFTSSGSRISHGTMVTMVENLGGPGAVRMDGKLVPKPTGHKGKWIDFGTKKRFCMTIPWGDLSTAHHTTGIPNIETYTGVSQKVYRFMKFQSLLNPLLRSRLVKKYLKKRIDQKVYGPSRDENEKGKTFVWGKVSNEAGKTLEAHFTGPEAYLLTANASLLIAQKLLKRNDVSGFQSPAGLFGHELLEELEGCGKILL
ncbi:MAG: saccharopine dehydrogenase NADP-binding domain-containing protein [Cyclobacteriaceae bacterium]|nr:saccharopine dehydrogenase NADP-binding domain-containing protein [Cyclobacteriaceae bacterium]